MARCPTCGLPSLPCSCWPSPVAPNPTPPPCPSTPTPCASSSRTMPSAGRSAGPKAPRTPTAPSTTAQIHRAARANILPAWRAARRSRCPDNRHRARTETVRCDTEISPHAWRGMGRRDSYSVHGMPPVYVRQLTAADQPASTARSSAPLQGAPSGRTLRQRPKLPGGHAHAEARGRADRHPRRGHRPALQLGPGAAGARHHGRRLRGARRLPPPAPLPAGARPAGAGEVRPRRAAGDGRQQHPLPHLAPRSASGSATRSAAGRC